MSKIEQELFDLEELLMRNDDVADRSIYITIVGIANDVSKLESENAKLWEYVEWLEDLVLSGFFTKDIEFEIEMKRRELGVPHD